MDRRRGGWRGLRGGFREVVGQSHHRRGSHLLLRGDPGHRRVGGHHGQRSPVGVGRGHDRCGLLCNGLEEDHGEVRAYPDHDDHDLCSGPYPCDVPYYDYEDSYSCSSIEDYDCDDHHDAYHTIGSCFCSIHPPSGFDDGCDFVTWIYYFCHRLLHCDFLLHHLLLLLILLLDDYRHHHHDHDVLGSHRVGCENGNDHVDLLVGEMGLVRLLLQGHQDRRPCRPVRVFFPHRRPCPVAGRRRGVRTVAWL